MNKHLTSSQRQKKPFVTPKIQRAERLPLITAGSFDLPFS